MKRRINPPISPNEQTRVEQLGRILPLWAHEIADTSLAGQERICRLLASGLRRERQRGIAAHWSYDVGRHAELVRVLSLELRRLARLRPKTNMPANAAGMSHRGIG